MLANFAYDDVILLERSCIEVARIVHACDLVCDEAPEAPAAGAADDEPDPEAGDDESADADDDPADGPTLVQPAAEAISAMASAAVGRRVFFMVASLRLDGSGDTRSHPPAFTLTTGGRE
ncbi:hypothetical protein GCM10022256_00980 [Frondihabitans peucedani]|uniref:Uncharacterized protein n=1 Tax=Frondihabitans peucedani TaxID=598626 RepID=A0ABP8DX37_9MICO